jgi:hypothetical protein
MEKAKGSSIAKRSASLSDKMTGVVWNGKLGAESLVILPKQSI